MANLVIRNLDDIPEEWLSEEQLRSRVNMILGQGDVLNTLYTLACQAGVQDKSYNTVRYGGVARYEGEGMIEYQGIRFKAVGYKPQGTPEFISMKGGIIFYQI